MPSEPPATGFCWTKMSLQMSYSEGSLIKVSLLQRRSHSLCSFQPPCGSWGLSTRELTVWHCGTFSCLPPSPAPPASERGWDDVWQFKNLINLVAPERRVSTEENLRKPPPILLPSPPRLPGSPRPPCSPRPTSPPCSRPSLERLSCNRCPCR